MFDEELTNGSGLIRDGVYERIRADILACDLAPGAPATTLTC